MIAYDALFIALADAADTPVVTADGKLLKALEGTHYTRFVHPLADAYSLSPARAENPGVYCNRADTG